MKIVADSQIPLARGAFSTMGDVLLVPGREISPDLVSDADVLLVRSVTPVNGDLLAKSHVRFVGSAASGIEHVDVGYLQGRGIGFASAVGGNANAVAEYVLSAIFAVLDQQASTLSGKTVGIVGCGRVGSGLLAKLRALGVPCLINDPPLKEKTGDGQYVDLNAVLSADIITLHVPLTCDGTYPTFHLVDEGFLGRLKPHAILINTSRGDVVNEEALKKALRRKGKPTIVLDVWQHEPRIDADLLINIDIGTPHIAGYSVDGKIRATEMIYEATCRFFNETPLWAASKDLSKAAMNVLHFSDSATDNEICQMAVLASYDARGDAAALKQMLRLPQDRRAAYFDALRDEYSLRREFGATVIHLPNSKRTLARRLNGVGFRVDIHEPMAVM
ncbi:MAG: 4-phosphoerythronate dehydrogenase [Gammaproteobacteria bacterium]|nr:4-phosphoerythronate dehydrogenase [Gammaproteobacteria bacterium]MCI0591065.1 4-phosphoerythronate dehydrogenase [Gammaproteobacteria bacterium]